jgi:hypothetical protein
MSLENLANLVKTNKLKVETFDQSEFDGLIKSGKARLKDAKIKALSTESRFDLAYNAAHALALAALRWHGYRPDNSRYIVFQALQHTLNLDVGTWRILDKCHHMRNVAEYEGFLEVEDQLLKDLISATQTVQVELQTLLKSRK